MLARHCQGIASERRYMNLEASRSAGAAPDGIQRIDAATAKYSDFVDVMKENQPAIFYNFGSLLPSFLPWQKNGIADVNFLRREFGDMEVPVVECSASKEYGDETRLSMTLRKYLDAVQDGRPVSPVGSDQERAWGSESDRDRASVVASAGSGEETVFYLKDWHFQRLRKEGSGDRGGGGEGGSGGSVASAATVETPFFFEDDWLNWWCDKNGQDDYRFVYIGPPGSFTGLHHDVLNSFSWSFNVCGNKHWTLFPTEATPALYDRHGRLLAKDFRSGCADPDKFPNLETAPRVEVWQGPGEAIFVPSGWHHQLVLVGAARLGMPSTVMIGALDEQGVDKTVKIGAEIRFHVINTGDGSAENQGLTISVNTNWFNGFNLGRVFSFLRSELSAVRAALEHLRDEMSEGRPGASGGKREWERQCELVMRANSALNLTDFARLVMAKAQQLLEGVPIADEDAETDASFDGEEEELSPPVSDSPAPASPHQGELAGRPLPPRPPLPTVVVAPTMAAAAAAKSSRRKNNRGDGGSEGTGGSSIRTSGAWREERWAAAALEEVAVVLRELSIAPCIHHIFLADDADDADDDGDDRGWDESNSTSGSAEAHSSIDGHSTERNGVLLRGMLAAVEAYLLAVTSTTSRKSSTHL